MFAVNAINFTLSSLNTGTIVAVAIATIRKPLIMDIDHSLSEMGDLVKSSLLDTGIIGLWAGDVPVSIKLPLLDPVSTHGRWR